MENISEQVEMKAEMDRREKNGIVQHKHDMCTPRGNEAYSMAIRVIWTPKRR